MCQLDFQLTIDVIDTNIFVSQFVNISATDDIELFVQFLSNDLCRISLTIVTGILLTVAHRRNRFAADGNTVNRGSGYVIDAGAGLDGNRRAGTGIEGNRTVCTINSYSRAVFTVNGNRAVCAFSRAVITGFFTKGNRVTQSYGKFFAICISCSRNITVTGNLDGFAKVLLNCSITVIGQSEATGTGRNGVHLIVERFKLIFCSSSTVYSIRISRIPGDIF